MCIPQRIGAIARIPDLHGGGSDADTLFFGEAPGGVVLAFDPANFDELAAICADIPFMRAGETGGSALILEGPTASLTLQVNEAVKAYEEAVPSSFE
jgi:hypothetical protein